MLDNSFDIVIIGTGNVANHIGPALLNAGHTILQVYGRSQVKAEDLAQKLNSERVPSLAEISLKADGYLLMGSDKAILKVLSKLPRIKGLVCHTSGAIGADLITDNGFSGGYFYPLQTFRTGEELELNNTPIFVRSDSRESEKKLTQLATTISSEVAIITDSEKQKLHLAAVVVNNFVNHLFGLTDDFLAQEGLSFKYLEPIIRTTVRRALKSNPKLIQTGPAKRNDINTIEKHMNMLDDKPLLQHVYHQLTKSIQSLHNED